MSMQYAKISKILILWYKKHKRDLPWRNTSDPYKIWLSEVILQQTRIEQGRPYYLRFIGKYPSITLLARAPKDEVLKLWQGLGYYNRAHNLIQTARFIVQYHNGLFPSSFNELIKLKGIGEYTAAAISSVAFGEARPAIDGNVKRVLSRIFGIYPLSKPSDTLKLYFNIAQKLLKGHNPGEFNQAMMDFGSTWCSPRNPRCADCPVKHFCFAYNHEKTAELPLPVRTGRIKKRYFNFFLAVYNQKICVEKRSSTDIWPQLYQLPLIETTAHIKSATLLKSEPVRILSGKYPLCITGKPYIIKHLLSHRLIICRFFTLKINNSRAFNYLGRRYKIISLTTIHKLAFPKPIEKFISLAINRNYTGISL